MVSYSKENSPLISIIMCTYNGGAYVAKQLDSLVRQTYQNIEIIISDDASTDDLAQTLHQYAGADKRIRLFFNRENIGFTKNFSNACAHATGDFIAFCDQDDIWHSEKIEKMLKAWKEPCDLIYCNSVRFKDEQEIPSLAENKRYRRFEGNDPRKIAIFNTVSGHAMMVKNEFLKRILPFPDGIMYDWWSAAVASCHGGVAYLNEIMVYQRVHGNNVSMGKGFSHLEKNHKTAFMQMVAAHLIAFSHIPDMSTSNRFFFEKLSKLWHESVNRRFSLPLFIFLLRNRSIVFWYKKRKFALFSHLKHSYKLSRN